MGGIRIIRIIRCFYVGVLHQAANNYRFRVEKSEVKLNFDGRLATEAKEPCYWCSHSGVSRTRRFPNHCIDCKAH